MESFDELIRRKLAQRPVPDFEEKYWLEAEKLLDEADRKRRRGLVFWAWPLAGLLVAGLGFYGYCFMGDRRAAVGVIDRTIDKPIEIRPNNPANDQLGQTGPDNKGDRTGNNFSDKKTVANEKSQLPKPANIGDEIKAGANQKGAAGVPGFAAKNLSQLGGKKVGGPVFPTIPGLENTSDIMGNKTGKLPETGTGKAGEATASPAGKPAQPIENQPVAAIQRQVFLLGFLPNRPIEQPLVFARRQPSFPFFKTSAPPVLAKKVDRERIRPGLQTAGFSSQKDNFGRRVYGGQIGVFAERKLGKRFAAQLFVDYKIIAGLNQSFDTNSDTGFVKQYRFGLEKISGRPVPAHFHHIVPGVNLRYNIFGKQWAEAGISERIWYGSHVKMAKVSTGAFGDVSEETIKGYSNKNYGWNKLVPEFRLGWSAGFGRNLQASIGYNRQLKTMAKRAEVAPGRYNSRNWFDVKLRYLLY